MFQKMEILIILVGLCCLIVFVTACHKQQTGMPIEIDNDIFHWSQISPLEMSRDEVIGILGPPTWINNCLFSSERSWVKKVYNCWNRHQVYIYRQIRSDRMPDDIHEVHFRSGVVWFVVEDARARPNHSQISVEQFVEEYGIPEQVTWSADSPFVNAVLFCKHGLILHANPNRISKIFYIPPMPTNQCLNESSFKAATENPFQDSSILNVEDPWGYNDMRN